MTNRGQNYSSTFEEHVREGRAEGSCLTGRRVGHDAERGNRLVADVVAVQQEAGEVFYGVERTAENFLGPLTHQATGGIAHLLLDVGDWTWRIQRFKLEADHTEMLGHTQCLAGRVTKLFERDGIGKQ